jgi:hypothetical protein
MSFAIVSSASVVASQLISQRQYETVTPEGLRSDHSHPRNYLGGTASDWLPSSAAALRAISTECRTPGWDGQGAVAIKSELVSITGRMVELLYRIVPTGTPPPDITAEADGDISLSWTIDAKRIFSVSIGAHGKMNFAGQFGIEGVVHGWKLVDTSNQSALQACLGEIAGYLEKLYPGAPLRRAA